MSVDRSARWTLSPAAEERRQAERADAVRLALLLWIAASLAGALAWAAR